MSKFPGIDFLSLTSVGTDVTAPKVESGGGGGKGNPGIPERSPLPSIFPLHHPDEGRDGIGKEGIIGNFGKFILDVKAAAAIAATNRVLNSEAKFVLEIEVETSCSFFEASC